MKKIFVISIFFTLILTVLFGGVAYAGSAFSNAKAYFKPSLYNPPPGAEGQAIINYDKQQQNWQVQVKVRNLNPGSQYSLEIGIQDQPFGGTVIATFWTDSKGNANFHNVATGLPETYNVARIIEGSTPIEEPWDTAKWRVKMIAQESGYWGLMKFHGDQRGE